MIHGLYALLIVSFFNGIAVAASSQKIDGFTSIMSVLNNPVSFNALVNELRNSKTNVLLERSGTNSKITLFAPTDKALNDFGQVGVLRGTPLLEQFLKHHMISGRWDRKRLRSHRTAQMLSGKQMNLKDIGKIAYTVEADNGIIHVIDKVILHPEIKKKLGIKSS